MIYAIGDIHGKYSLLRELYDKILEDIAQNGDSHNVIVFLGDYIDRGSQNIQVLDFIKNLQDSSGIEHIFLRGNHEEIFKSAMEYPHRPWFTGMWVQNGGKAVLNEVGMEFAEFNASYPWQGYVNWFDTRLENYYETDDYVFVHGGLDISVQNMRKQDDEMLQWARFREEDHYASFHKLVVHGHSPVEEPQVDKNRINVDTGRSYAKDNGRRGLTAVALPNERDDTKIRFIQVIEPIQN
jgi:serine/threonine protein phosphatase 1